MMLALLDGFVEVGQRIIDTADVPDAAPFGEGLVTRGGVIGYAFGRRVRTMADDRTSDVKKPRAARTTRAGIDVFVGFGFPGGFQELGTVHHAAQPFLGPATDAVLGSGEFKTILMRRFT